MARYMCRVCGPASTTMGAVIPKVCPLCGRSEYFREIHMDNKQVVPDYWREYLEERIAHIRKLQTQAGWDSVSFGAVADIHVVTNAWHSAALMEEVYRRCCVPYFFNAGDTISGAGHCIPEDLWKDVDDFREAFAPIESRCLMVEGNHDPAYSAIEGPGTGYIQSVTQAEFNENYFRCETLYPGRTFGPDGSYYFADDTVHKMRYIILNSHDMPDDEECLSGGAGIYRKFMRCTMRQQQMDWFTNVALDVPGADWTVTLCTHENPASGEGEYVNCGDLILGVLNAFRNHTSFSGEHLEDDAVFNVRVNVDYTGRGGDFTAWVSGHTHRDIFCQPEGINCLSIKSDSCDRAKFGTIHEQTFDVFTVNKKERKLYITRIGEGEDRVIDY